MGFNRGQTIIGKINKERFTVGDIVYEGRDRGSRGFSFTTRLPSTWEGLVRRLGFNPGTNAIHMKDLKGKDIVLNRPKRSG
jgi:hypothetical protein